MSTYTDAEAEFEGRLADLDVTLLKTIPSQSSRGCRSALLAVQRAVREAFRLYTYLEIGSHLGGSLQAHYLDPRCRLIYSIDKRPPTQWDDRGEYYDYPDNSTTRMLELLHRAFPEMVPKVVPFDGDAWDCDPELIAKAPQIAFIDGEHTINAAYRDFRFCMKVVDRDWSVILFHDTWIVYNGISLARRYLMEEGLSHEAMMLSGNVYALLLGGAATLRTPLTEVVQNESEYLEAQLPRLNETRAASGQELMIYRRPENYSSADLAVMPPVASNAESGVNRAV
jgi:hypothetical protein